MTPDFPLTLHQLRFSVRVKSDIFFKEFPGSALRGALTNVLQRQFCPADKLAAGDPLHRQLCPLCRLLAAERDEEDGGDVRRPFALRPPTDGKLHYEPGEQLTFGLTLMGDLSPLPMLVLAVHEMGQEGIGGGRHRGLGQFVVEALEATHPLDGRSMQLLAANGSVRLRTFPVTNADVTRHAAELANQLAESDNLLQIDLLTPLRLTQGETIARTPAFFPLVKTVARRLLDLCTQHGDGRPADVELRRDLYPFADRVELVHDATEWKSVNGYSNRQQRLQPLDGLTGSAVYRSADWTELLPWLVWGELTQAGKSVVKGCGLYTLRPATIYQEVSTWPSFSI